MRRAAAGSVAALAAGLALAGVGAAPSAGQEASEPPTTVTAPATATVETTPAPPPPEPAGAPVPQEEPAVDEPAVTAPKPAGQPQEQQATADALAVDDVLVGLSVPSSLTLEDLELGTQSAGTASVTVSAPLTDWALSVAAGAGGTGQLMPVGCDGWGPPAEHLWVEAGRDLLGAPSSVAGVSLSTTDQQIAAGTGSATFPVTVSQVVGPSERLGPGCSYQATIVYTLIA